MNDYDFSTLNDKEFEILASDLLSKHFNTKIDRFKPGPDQGIDGRFFANDGSEVILQYKHYFGSGTTKLLYDLENKEAEKVKKLNPKRYIIATSVPLSAANKTKIKAIFYPYIQNDNDIFGKENLNDLLKDYPEIQKAHFKLWLSSTTVLEAILNNAINGRSRSYLEEIKADAKLYVETEKHMSALPMIDKSNVIIITGEPGVGKTTLAESLCLYYCNHGYQLCVIEDSLSEAEAVYPYNDKSTKIVFYFDDFLGSNYLQALKQHQDTHITRFIQRVRKDENKKFILTSRTNIFYRGVSLSDRFKDKKIDSAEFVLSVNSLPDLDKAKILYNHMWFKGLSKGRVDQIYLDKRYLKIINHRNYNPRLIEYITDNDRLDSVGDDQYWGHVETILNTPSEIWRTPFSVQSDQLIRNIVLLVVFSGGTISDKDLRNAYNEICKLEQTVQNTNISKSFDLVIRPAVGFFLNRTLNPDSSVTFSPFNPSVSDFILAEYKENTPKLALVYCSLKKARSLRALYDLNKNKKIETYIYQKVLHNLIESFDIQTLDRNCVDYFVYLIDLLETNNLLSDVYHTKLIAAFERILSDPVGLSLLEEFSHSLINILNLGLKVPIEKVRVHRILRLADSIPSDLRAAMYLIDHFEIDDDDIIEKISALTHDYLCDSLADECLDIDISDFWDSDHEYNILVDEDRLGAEIKERLQGLIDDLGVPASFYIDDGEIYDSIDQVDLVNEFFSRDEGDWAPEEHISGGNSDVDSIDDLFDRSGSK